MATPAPQVAWRLIAVVALACLGAAPAAAAVPPVVHEEVSLTVRAGITDAAHRLLQFGDELHLSLHVTFERAAIEVIAPDESFFTSAWPQSEGPALLGWTLQREAGTLRAEYRFQLVTCPRAELTCPGDRHYLVPAFVLHVKARGDIDAEPRAIPVRPAPGELRVSTTIEPDAENELQPFSNYFPDGAYPEPWPGSDATQAALVSGGTALAMFLGGLIMWPFRGGRKQSPADRVPRWRRLLDDLQAHNVDDESRYFDTLRRSVVWYCNDELSLDPFLWLDLAEHPEEPRDATGTNGLRSLFVELLHTPPGRATELRETFERLVGPARGA